MEHMEEDGLQRIINFALSSGATFAEIRIEEKRGLEVRLTDGVLEVVKSFEDRGAAVRTIYRGAWGFSYTTSLTYNELKESVGKAIAISKSVSSEVKQPVSLAEVPSIYDVYEWPVKRDLRDVALEEKLKDLIELDRMISSANPAIKSRTIRYVEYVHRRTVVSSDEVYVEEIRPLVWLYIWVTGAEGGVRASAREELGSIEGYVIFDKWSKEELAERLSERVANQLRAKTPKGGIFPAVLAPNVVGVFVHEAFGHLAEADLTVAGSAVKDKFGERIASELVTIEDSPHVPDGFGNMRYDDEGVKAESVTLVERGVMRGVMLDRHLASVLGRKPTGNARAESFRVPPLIRMRNTVLRSGDYSVEELFEGIDFGYYLVSFRGGQANLDGAFQVGIQEAYEIVNGEVGDPVRNLSISGNTLTTLSEVDAVADDFRLEYGRCGKIQSAFVSSGGPHIRVRRITVGGYE